MIAYTPKKIYQILGKMTREGKIAPPCRCDCRIFFTTSEDCATCWRGVVAAEDWFIEQEEGWIEK